MVLPSAMRAFIQLMASSLTSLIMDAYTQQLYADEGIVLEEDAYDIGIGKELRDVETSVQCNGLSSQS